MRLAEESGLRTLRLHPGSGAARLLGILLPFTQDRTLEAQEMLERVVLAIISAICGPLLCFYAWQNQANGQTWFAGISLASGLLLLWSLARVRVQRERWGPRLAFVGVILVLCTALFVPNDRLTLNWATALPMMLVFFFGIREGGLWCAVLFLSLAGVVLTGNLTGRAPDLPQWPSPSQFFDFAVAYLVVAASATGYETLRIAYARTARVRRAQLEAALEARRASEDRLRDFTETASDWLFELDRDLCLTHLSGRFEALTGIPAESLVGRSGMEEVDGWTFVSGAEFVAALRERAPFRDVRVEMVSDDGRHLHMNVRGHPIEDEHGAFAGFRAAGTDVTAQEEAQRELRETSRALQHASKMEAVGQLTSGVAHDFNNLLTVIMGNLELVAMRLDRAGMQDDGVVRASAAAQRAADLTDKLLAFSRRQSLRPVEIPLPELLAGTAELLTRTLPETIHVSARSEDGAWACEADRSQLENALLNLALNARDAMPDGGALELTVRNAPLGEEAAEGWSVTPGDYVLLSVRDDGEGISGELLDHIFEPFFSTKPNGEGTGLGLSMVYGFARQSGGGIRVLSTPGSGTTVELALPRASGAALPEPTDRPRVEGHGDGRAVLVIEDEPAVRDLVVAMLQRLGYTPRAASSGEEAVALFGEERPEIVVSDVVLSGRLTGVDAVNAIRALDPEVPAMFMSGYSESVFEDRSRLPQGVGLLAKPFGIAELEARLETLQRRAATVGEDAYAGVADGTAS